MFKRLVVFLVVMACIFGTAKIGLAAWNPNFDSSAGQSATDYDIAEPAGAPIPHEALRLRIIANSDSPQDQELKREVRDAVVVAVGNLLKNVHTPEQAKALVTKNIPYIQAISKNVVEQHGYRYSVNTVVGMVPFPTKIYGNRVYPAGNYEALRIVIGQGRGQNWWCVLFPPLCFVDIATGDAVPNTGGFPDLPPLETIQVPTPSGQSTKVAVRLASVDYGEELVNTVKHWFHSGSTVAPRDGKS